MSQNNEKTQQQEEAHNGHQPIFLAYLQEPHKLSDNVNLILHTEQADADPRAFYAITPLNVQIVQAGAGQTKLNALLLLGACNTRIVFA